MSSIVLLDGGMGQELVRRAGEPPTPLWSTHILNHYPELVQALHEDFIRAGARVITLATYTATPERLSRDGQAESLEMLHRRALECAQKAVAACGEDVAIAGCLPPLVASYRPDQSPTGDAALASYRRMVAAGQGVDLWLCEAMASLDEMRTAATAASETGLPVWIAVTLDDANPGRLRSQEPLADAVALAESLGVQALLINCSQPETIEASLDLLTGFSGMTGAYPNGFTSVEALAPGGTVSSLEARLDLDPEAFTHTAMRWVDHGIDIIGGCCEVGPSHIARLAESLGERGHAVVRF
ncbi:Homocysteine/selenocysteine methylase (S-methylmethionine-dependent) [Onishia taeanensis]|uniref:Homocysteine/selenocysteine methylase (S-methylmethionine-dependent) n=1 Tax=Onishia taeanensis TaxID=284577 RepID=A0A1G7UL41_9GAMM|nr:homocysteine S-methyltransferase family protein [Halomonas taeanensis]SDG48213.1 Homocysteine/selenocysteine methylase (S-methylmethionine-dependent) [Halomonas taeanensis]